jgi:hypothetical protein
MRHKRASKRRLFRAILGAAIALTAITVTSTPAQGALSDCGPADYTRTYHGGFYWPYKADWNSGGHRFEGASAEITVRSGAVCGSDTNRQNFSDAWSMIAGASDGWVQSGYERWHSSSIYFFSQTYRGSGFNPDTYYDLSTALTVGSVFRFWQQYDGNCFCLHSNVNTRRLLSTSWNPFGNWTEPFSPQFAGEVRYRASDLPGSSTRRADFTKLQAQNFYGDGWVSMPHGMTSVNDNTTRWVVGAVSDTHIYVYTK